jgi:hypothetical protein
MSKRIWRSAVAAVAGIIFVAGVAVAATTVHRAHGRFTDVDSTRREAGVWHVGVVTRTRGGNSGETDVILATAKHLDVSGASAANPPSFHVWMVSSDTLTAADFGAMRVNRRGNAAFKFDTRRGATLPSGVTSLSTFSGGTIEVRDGTSAVVLSSTLP